MRASQFLVPFLLFFHVVTFGQSNGIETALQKGKATDLGLYFSRTVEIAYPGVEDSYSADDAVVKLDEFFAQQTVKGYKRVHLSSPQEGRSNFTIGDLYTANGTYRISLYFDTEHKITEVRIQK